MIVRTPKCFDPEVAVTCNVRVNNVVKVVVASCPTWRRLEQHGRSSLTPAERSLRARIGAYSLHATHDPRETTEPARHAFIATFEAQVDPLGELPEPERLRRAEAARKAYFTRLALRSVKARRRSR